MAEHLDEIKKAVARRIKPKKPKPNSGPGYYGDNDMPDENQNQGGDQSGSDDGGDKSGGSDGLIDVIVDGEKSKVSQADLIAGYQQNGHFTGPCAIVSPRLLHRHLKVYTPAERCGSRPNRESPIPQGEPRRRR